MSKKIYVGNLSFETTEDQVNEMFTKYGKVDSISMITDRTTGQFRGFCFVGMEESAANAAIKALNETNVEGRVLRVNEARPREERNNNSNKKRNNKKFPDSGGSTRW